MSDIVVSDEVFAAYAHAFDSASALPLSLRKKRVAEAFQVAQANPVTPKP
jgi:hypothetical protein